MRSIRKRVFIKRSVPSWEKSFFKKETKQDRSFFGAASHETFFHPSASIQRKCEKCEEEEKQVHRMSDQKEDERKLQRQPEKKEEEKLQRKEADPSAEITSNYYTNISGGQNLPEDVNHFYASKMGHDFSEVKIHTDSEAAKSAGDINARAYTKDNHIVFNKGEYNPATQSGKKLLAHELTHVVQQGNSNKNSIQRAVQFNVLDWSASSPGTPTLTNTPDLIVIPPTNQVLISGLIEVNGDSSDPCNDYEFGTTQTAWMAWVQQYYRGRTAADGSITVQYNASMPMRDPGVGGSIWYDNGRVRSPAACGDSVGVFHNDGPWQGLFKTRNNSAVAGSPLNYLVGYTRGLHLVTYLVGKRTGGNYLPRPLKFRYWNSIQNFAFTPNYSSPSSSWSSTGGVRVNIGSQGSGETSDAPYYTSAGANYNTHFNNASSWTVSEHK